MIVINGTGNNFQNNIKLLTEQSTVSVAAYENAEITAVKTETSKTGALTFKLLVNNKTKYFHSKFDPHSEAEKFAESLDIQPNETIFVFGFGFAYYAISILGRCGENNRVVCLEPSKDIFASAVHNLDLTELLTDKRFSLALCDDDRKISDFVSANTAFKMKIAIIPVYSEVFPELCKLFAETCKNSLSSDIISKNTAILHSKTWHKAFFEALPHTVGAADIRSLKGIYSGRPCVLVSAGPSLDKNSALLKQIEGKLPVFCVYTAYKALLTKGIKPDFVVSIDSSQTKFETEEERAQKYKTTLIFSQISERALLDKFTGKKILLPDTALGMYKSLLGDIYKQTDYFPVNLTVAYTALELCGYTGTDCIIFVGQDFALSGGRSHASGTFYDNKNLIPPEDEQLFTEDVFGGRVATTETFNAFRNTFEEYIAENPGIRFIDATEGGSKIRGTEISTLSDVITEYGNVAEFGDELRSALDTSANRAKLPAVLASLRKTRRGFAEARDACNLGIAACEKLDKIYETRREKIKTKEISESLARLDECDGKIKKIGEGMSFLNMLLFNEFDFITQLEHDSSVSEERYIIYKNRLMYDAVKKGSEESIAAIDTALAELEALC